MGSIRRTLGLVVMGGVCSGTWVAAATMYTWHDARGVPHYSNVPVTGQRAIPIDDAETTAAEPDPAVPQPAVADDGAEPAAAPVAARDTPTAISDDERDQFSSHATLRRQGLERTYRAARRKLADVERQLASLGRTRTQHAARGTNAAGAVADEERPLLTAKTAIEAELDQTRGAYAALATEVSARFGSLPDWWVGLR